MSATVLPAGETAQTRFAEVGVAVAVVFIIALLVVPLGDPIETSLAQLAPRLHAQP